MNPLAFAENSPLPRKTLRIPGSESKKVLAKKTRNLVSVTWRLKRDGAAKARVSTYILSAAQMVVRSGGLAEQLMVRNSNLSGDERVVFHQLNV